MPVAGFSLSTAKPGDGAMPGEYVVTLGEYYPPDKPPAPAPKAAVFLPSRFPAKLRRSVEVAAYGDRGAR